MDNKKIYQMLQQWFPELRQRPLPKKKHREQFEVFINWLYPEKMGGRYSTFLMKINRNEFHENEIERCAIFHEFSTDSSIIQTRIRQRAQPLFEHYEQHKEAIGRYYNVQDQVYDIIFEEILLEARRHQYELLLIYAEDYYWLLVPNHDDEIEKFSRRFNKQFKDEDISIEHYALLDCPWST